MLLTETIKLLTTLAGLSLEQDRFFFCMMGVRLSWSSNSLTFIDTGVTQGEILTWTRDIHA